MAEQEIDTIKHLIEIEKSAALLITEAQTEADKKIALAKSKADANFKEQAAKIVSEKEAAYEARIKEAAAKYNNLLSEYKTKIENSLKSIDFFNNIAEKYLFA
ncbi:MAG: hypothetical protein II921_03550 [Treponema sp.]|nr:hypothetical protein [Treponema sp.]